MIKQKVGRKISLLERILITLFVFLSIIVLFVPRLKIDLQISHFIQNVQISFFPELMLGVSQVGNHPFVEIVILLVLMLLFKLGLKIEAFTSLLIFVGSALIGSLIKLAIQRPRPGEDLVNVLVKLNDNSFPSNHVLIFTAFFGFLLYLSLHVFKEKRAQVFLGTISALLVLTVGISRIYLGAHWASDVIGGYLLGTIILISAIQIYKKIVTA